MVNAGLGPQTVYPLSAQLKDLRMWLFMMGPVPISARMAIGSCFGSSNYMETCYSITTD
jgi:hypothetical protein